MSVGDVTRLTSANLVVQFKPALYPNINARSTLFASYDTAMNHIVVLNLNGATAGTFRLKVDGYETANITAGVALAAATVQSALEGLPNVATGDLAVTGSAGGPFTITAAQALLNKFLIIEIELDTMTGGDPYLTITQQGSDWYTISAEASSFSYTSTQETTDVTAIAEKERRHEPTVSDATFEISLYETLADYRSILKEGIQGYLRIYEDGVYDDAPYFAWEILLTDAEVSMEMFEKIEISLSGRRQGAPIARVGSRWNG